jgi:hypothetical protein
MFKSKFVTPRDYKVIALVRIKNRLRNVACTFFWFPLGEAERSLHDALCVLTSTVKEPR